MAAVTLTASGCYWYLIAITGQTRYTQGQAATSNVAFGTAPLAGNYVTYSVNVAISNDINSSSPGSAFTIQTGTATAAVYATAPVMVTSSSNIRRFTNEVAWIEWEAPSQQNTTGGGNGWTVTATCGTGASFNPANSAAIAGSAVTTLNYLLLQVDFTAGNSAQSCALSAA